MGFVSFDAPYFGDAERWLFVLGFSSPQDGLFRLIGDMTFWSALLAGLPLMVLNGLP